ncbi:GNAT family N-acetyltransferase [Cohnella hongkongensis]|uniref:GNAT family N-acetyltransferase n=1 Tax=Cohnella hongkongensis TaxID=178337 RepID=A0ABV9F6C9_9BACL
MNARVVSTRAGLRQLEEDWNALTDSMETCDPYDTFDWVEESLNSVHPPDIRLFVIVVYEETKCVAIAPLYVASETKGFVKIRVLRSLNENQAPYCSFCLHREYSEIVLLRAIMAALEERRGEWDLLHLADLNTKSNMTFLAEKLWGESYRTYAHKATMTPYLKFKNYPGKVNKHQIKEIERKERKLCKEHEVKIRIDQPYSQAVWDRLIELNVEKWDRTSKFISPGNRRLYERFASGWNRGRLSFSYIEIDGRIEAISLCIVFNNNVYGKFMNYAPEFARRSVGLILTHRLIRHMHEQGMEECDFEDGTQAYKFYWTDTVRNNYHLQVVNNNGKRGWLVFLISMRIVARTFGLLESYHRTKSFLRSLTRARKRGKTKDAEARGIAWQQDVEMVGNRVR